MQNLTLKQIANILKITTPVNDCVIRSINTDTRTLQSGDLFVPLQGASFDGHDYIAVAEERGAVAVLASKPITSKLPVLYVANTLHAFGELAHWWRMQFNIPVIGITGSCGKTTTKAMLAAILAEQGQVLASQGTFNNEFGVPLTLLRLTAGDRYAVIEMGANHMGEIAYVAKLAKPDLAIITNAGPVHLEGFGDVAGVARAKGEIYQALAPQGIAIINADDAYLDYWRELVTPRKYITFGLCKTADVYATDIKTDAEGYAHFQLHCVVGVIAIRLNVLGEHNVSNALAAAAAALQLGIPLAAIQTALANMQPVAKRTMRYQGWGGATLLDDTYNSNPVAFRAALALLRNTTPGEKILVMGDMAELGSETEAYHRQAGLDAKAYGVQRMFTIGKLTALAAEAFGVGAQHFTDRAALINILKTVLNANVAVLIKGSRSARMEDIIEALKLV